eukprot:NODE_3215_length_395_cov_177.462428_g2568_i0.p2 GENE.NODE_3215_length_395_cov_177.462428_g2568_i0~~NODE_3215_length_395_cov_177.462428_g2568_i0.p2  ORF type:complete len:54 (-),score=7.23 NODE_3215_length_395_cov_177.462428_g2568_i0:177-338(-)
MSTLFLILSMLLAVSSSKVLYQAWDVPNNDCSGKPDTSVTVSPGQCAGRLTAS